MRVIIATVQVPFVRGGAETHAEGLRDALRAEGHEADVTAVPFKWYPPERILDHMLACRLLDLTASFGVGIDRVIGLKFPAYLVKHPNKVLWLLHQHRSAYDLWGHPLDDMCTYPSGAQVREAVWDADRRLLPEAKAIYTNSANVSNRLKRYCDVDSQPLYHPPRHAEQFYCAAPEDYFFYPSRLDPSKRQGLVVQALALTSRAVRVYFAGTGAQPAALEELKALAIKHGVQDRVEWLGAVGEGQKRDLYARSLGVIFPPLDEDYGYVTLEAMLSSKAVVTCTDSGGPLEFVVDRETGAVAEPTPVALAAALDRLWGDRGGTKALGEAGRARYQAMDISWPTVVRRLVA
ncbi:MAG TPA: glycosyltransferase family 4 protein [Gemmataceae bacterium]|nr:glycosyltransferase family 4 protein [Gemmataceae bacterium]